MDNSKLRELIIKLREITLSDKLDWRETVQKDIFQVSFTDYTLQIGKFKDYGYGECPDEEYYKLTLLNEKGRTIEEILQSDVSKASLFPNTYLQEIFEGARRKAMDFDHALDDIIASLNKGVEI